MMWKYIPECFRFLGRHDLSIMAIKHCGRRMAHLERRLIRVAPSFEVIRSERMAANVFGPPIESCRVTCAFHHFVFVATGNWGIWKMFSAEFQRPWIEPRFQTWLNCHQPPSPGLTAFAA